MNRAVKTKNIIAFAVVLIVLISITVTPCYAVNIPLSLRQRFGAGIASALLALNITMQSTIAPYEQMLDYVGGPLNQVIEYTFPETNWEDDILNQSVIQIWDEYTEIDGVKYTDVWLSNEAAEKFRVNAWDFKTAYSIASNTNGTFASGVGSLDGSPAYNVNGTIKTQTYTIPGTGLYNIGASTVNNDAATGRGGLTLSDGATNSWGYYITEAYKQKWNSYIRFNGKLSNGNRVAVQGTGYVASPFDFDYVAGTIPADQPLPSNTGMMIRVPSDDLRDFVDNHTEFQNNAPVELDFDLHPELKIDAEDLFDVIAPILADLDFGDIQFVINHEAPIPPVPDVPIIDATVPQVVQPIINEIQNQGDIISQSIPPIIESIPKIDEICNNIDTAPYHDLDTGLDRLPSFFLPFITDLRSALGIWHYVTEWLAQISTTFAFITGCLVGTSIMTPIYAAIAGFMCIKIYRRMTA